MTIAQAERFYKQDDKKYNIFKNKELLVALKLLYSDKTIPERGYVRAKRIS